MKHVKKSFWFRLEIAFVISLVLSFNPLSTFVSASSDAFNTSSNAYRTYNNIPFTGKSADICSVNPVDAVTVAAGSIPKEGMWVSASNFGGRVSGGSLVESLADNGGNDLGTHDNHLTYGTKHTYNGQEIVAGPSFAELGGPNGNGTALGSLEIHAKIKITYKGKSIIAMKEDIGQGSGGDNTDQYGADAFTGFNITSPPPPVNQPVLRAVDLWWQTANDLGINTTVPVFIQAVDDSTPATTATANANPTPSPSASSGTIKYSLGNVTPFTAAVASIVGNEFGVKTIYGWREPDGYNEHSSGRALDIMVNDDGRNTKDKMVAFGDPIAEYLKKNAKNFHIKHIIWKQHIWTYNQDGSTGNNKPMSDRGDLTQNHFDHLHVWLYETTEKSPANLVNAVTNLSDNCIAISGDLLQTTLNYAWSERNHKPPLEMKPAYQTAITNARAQGKFVGGVRYPGIDCGGFVTRVMQDSGTDPEYGAGGNTVSQYDHMASNPNKYQKIQATSTADLKPGDIAITEQNHTFLYVGEQAGFQSTVAEASIDSYAPMAGSSDPLGSDYKGVKFDIFRFIGQSGS